MIPPPEALPDAAPRLAQDRYVLLAKVGKGGMAGVYAAWDVREQDWRAIKVLLPRFARDKAIRTRFANEGTTMARLRHPNLVRVYDIGSAPVQTGPDLPFIVMELLNGGSLHRWVKTNGRMPPRLATAAAIQLLQGLEAVHEAGVVHRDVKPKNVLADHASVLKLTDFGIAQLEASNETKTGLAMGTLGYMAPEQLHDAKSVDPRSDLYAVAATMWTLLTTKKPRDLFRLEDRPDLMEGVSEGLRPILGRCLAYERTDRPPGARAVADELRAVLVTLPADPPDTPPLSLNLGMPDTRSVTAEVFSELSLSVSGGVFQGGGSGSTGDPFALRAPPGPAAAPEPAPLSTAGGRRLGPKTLDPTRSWSDLREPEAPAPAAEPEPEPPAAPPLSYAAFRRASDDRDERPSYLDEEPERPEPLPPPKPRPGPAAPVKTIGALGMLGMGFVVGTFFFGMALAGWALAERSTLVGAEDRFLSEGVDLDRQVSYLDSLPEEISAIGGDGAPLRIAWDTWRSAEPGAERTVLAIAFLESARSVALPLLPSDARTHEQELVHQRLTQARKDLEQAEYALGEWRSATEGPVAGAILAMGLASPPPGDLP